MATKFGTKSAITLLV